MIPQDPARLLKLAERKIRSFWQLRRPGVHGRRPDGLYRRVIDDRVVARSRPVHLSQAAGPRCGVMVVAVAPIAAVDVVPGIMRAGGRPAAAFDAAAVAEIARLIAATVVALAMS